MLFSREVAITDKLYKNTTYYSDDLTIDSKTRTSNPNWAVERYVIPKSVLPYTRFIRSGIPGAHFSGRCSMIPRRAGAEMYEPLIYGPTRWKYFMNHSVSYNQASFKNLIDAHSTDLINEVNSLVRERMSRKKFEGLVELGELDKSLEMIHYRVRQAADFIEGFRRKKRRLYADASNILHSRYLRSVGKPTRLMKLEDNKRRKQIIKDLKDAYLEFTYGWGPLASGITDALIATYESQHKRRPRSKVSAKAHKEFSINKVYFNQTGAYGVPTSFTLKEEMKLDLTVWGGGLLMPRAKLMQPHSEAAIYGFEFSEIGSALWELVPGSFLVDYFTNIGEFIANLGDWATDMISGSMYRSVKATARQYVDIYDIKMSPTYYWTQTLESATVTPSIRDYMYFNRVPLSYGDWRIKIELEMPSWHRLINTLLITTTDVKRWIL